ncbi:MAG TPA: homoserine kinase [Polyangiaceae bacterium]|nr:homoserine kinase [Polyangiaceae bacterium]
MALLTALAIDEARALGRLFGVEVEALRPIARGSVNSNFELGLAGGKKAFLRIYEESDHDAVVTQNRLLRHLVEHGVPTPAPLKRDNGGTVAEHAGKPVVLFPFCEGDFVCQRAVDARRLDIVGRALATIHRAGEDYADAPPNRFGPDALRDRITALRARPLPSELARTVESLAERLTAITASQETVIHGDVFRDNVLWRDDGSLSAIVDFESASCGSAAFDLMVTLLAWCFTDRLDVTLARALVNAYEAVRPLDPDELAACYPEARAACVRFGITRITDYELRPRDVVVHKDYRRFVGRLEALEAIGERHFAAWLRGTAS